MNADVVAAPTSAPDYRLICRFCTKFRTFEVQELIRHQEQECPSSPDVSTRATRKTPRGKRRR